MSSWPWSRESHRRIITLAQRIAAELGGYRDGGGSQGVDPSHVAAVEAFAQQAHSPKTVRSFLSLAPDSYLARYTGAAGRQVPFVSKVLAKHISEVEQLVREDGSPLSRGEQLQAIQVTLGWARRLLRTQERQRDSQGGRGPHRGRQDRGGPGRSGGGRGGWNRQRR